MASARDFGPGYTTTSNTLSIPQITTPNVMAQLNQLIPGLTPTIGNAMTNISSLISGTESPAISKALNAQFGVKSGMAPTSDFLKNREMDLFENRSNARQQLGLQNLSALLSGVTNPFSAISGQGITQRGQDIQSMLQNRGLDIQQQQQSSSAANADDQLTLQALGLLLNANR